MMWLLQSTTWPSSIPWHGPTIFSWYLNHIRSLFCTTTPSSWVQMEATLLDIPSADLSGSAQRFDASQYIELDCALLSGYGDVQNYMAAHPGLEWPFSVALRWFLIMSVQTLCLHNCTQHRCQIQSGMTEKSRNASWRSFCPNWRDEVLELDAILSF